MTDTLDNNENTEGFLTPPVEGEPELTPSQKLMRGEKPSRYEVSTRADLSDLMISPTGTAASTLRTLVQESNDPEQGLTLKEYSDALQRGIDKIHGGDLIELEASLFSQAKTLESMFHQLAQMGRAEKRLDHMKTYVDLCLKAQRQSRATLETLALVKNPVFPQYVRQQNLAMNQQVNNGQVTADANAEDKFNKSTNELLLADRRREDETLDTGGKIPTISLDKRVVAMEEIHRPEK